MTRAWIAGVIVVVGTADLAAQAPPPVRLTLEEAIDRGIAASHRLAEATARSDAATARAEAQHASGLPQVTAQAGYTRTNHVNPFAVPVSGLGFLVIYPDIPDNYRTRLDVEWPLFTSGRVNALERAARAEAGASTDELAAARLDLRLEITRAYWALVADIESVRVVDESVDRMNAHVRDVRNQLGAGLLPPNDVSSAEAQESRQRMLSVQAHAALDNASAELARLIGVPTDTGIEPASMLTAPAPAPTTVAALVEQAKTRRTDRAALAQRVTAASERRAAAQTGQKPTVGVAGGVDYARPNPKLFPRQDAFHWTWDAGVNLNWPLFTGGRVAAEVGEAAANQRAAEARLADFDQTLDLDVRQRARDLEAALASIASADDAVRSATDARRVVGDRFGAGVAVSADVLDAQIALLQAEVDRTLALAAARLAEARLDRALGR